LNSEEYILVVPSDSLSFMGDGIDADPAHLVHLLEVIESSGEFLLRDQKLEQNTGYRQIIPYVILLDYFGNDVIYYVRTGGNESRLNEKCSIGFGGHVNIEDDFYGDAYLTLLECAKRELSEETGMNTDDFTPLCVINSMAEDVSAVHMGVVFISNALPASLINPEPGIKIGSIKIQSLPKLMDTYTVEDWSKLLIREMPNLLVSASGK